MYIGKNDYTAGLLTPVGSTDGSYDYHYYAQFKIMNNTLYGMYTDTDGSDIYTYWHYLGTTYTFEETI